MFSKPVRSGLVFLILLASVVGRSADVHAAGRGQPYDWGRFYYYPYVYYPHNFQGNEQYDNLYYRYPPSRQIPVYNTNWYNFYPEEKPYYSGHHFYLDVF